jgi:DNA transformation protein
MAVSPEYRDFVAELLMPLGPVSLRRMFGGVGVFHDGLMFALLIDDTLYFKVDEQNRGDFEAAGQGPFRYQAKGRTRGLKSYYQVPPEVLEDADDCLAWGRGAVDAALRAQRRKAPKGKAKRG